MLTKFAVITTVLLVGTALAGEAPMKIRIRMKGVKRDASHLANYYLPALMHGGGFGGHGGGGGGYGGGGGGYGGGNGYGGASHQHLQVLDIKLPQHGGHYIPSYALPTKSYESTAHHFPIHTPQFSNVGQQYVLSGGGHGGNFEELAKALGGSQGGHSSAAQYTYGAGASSGGHGIAASAAPAYSFHSQSFGGAQQAALGGHGGGYSLAGLQLASGGAEASKTGPISFGGASSQQSAGQQQSAFGGHQFGFVSGGGHGQGAAQVSYTPQTAAYSAGDHGQSFAQFAYAPQAAASYAPQAEALTSSGGHEEQAVSHYSFAPQSASLGSSSGGHGQVSTPVYAAGVKGLSHYATGGASSLGGLSLGGSSLGGSSLGHGLTFGGGLQSLNLGGLSLGGHSLGGGYGSSHGQYILDTSALKGLNLQQVGGKYVLMSKPTALSYGSSQVSQKYTTPTASYGSSASLGSSSGAYKSAAPFKPSVFLGATQESISEYDHDHYGQASSSGSYGSAGSSGGH